MIPMTAAEIASIIGGELHGGDIAVTQPPVFDSRLAQEGSIFLALEGEKEDGHRYIGDAFAHGAVVALTTTIVPERCIVVGDVIKALSELARYVRGELRDMKVIAITGSQGKTTTKDLLASVLSGYGQTVATEASFNNEIGLPITLLRCTRETKYCIVEMGARHSGDISLLCEIAKPDIGVVLIVGSAHIGEFGSVEMIAQTKGELVEALGPHGVAILGLYDPYTPLMRERHSGATLTFGEDGGADVRATDVEIREGAPHFELVTASGREAVGMRVIGAHQVANALAAAAVCTALHLPLDFIAGALSSAELTSKWRMEISEHHGLLLINDAYNANPESMAAALRTLALFSQERGGESWAFLGKMHELGESSRQQHEEIGNLAHELGIDHIIAVGCDDYGAHARRYSDKESAMELLPFIHPGDSLLCKASRAEKFEELVDMVKERWSPRGLEGEGER